MSLTLVPSLSSSSQKQIAINLSTSSVVYTVPAGKTFTGYIMSWSTSGGASINGVSVYVTSGTAGFASGMLPVTLLAGTVVAGLSAAGTLIGVEQ